MRNILFVILLLTLFAVQACVPTTSTTKSIEDASMRSGGTTPKTRATERSDARSTTAAKPKKQNAKALKKAMQDSLAAIELAKQQAIEKQRMEVEKLVKRIVAAERQAERKIKSANPFENRRKKLESITNEQDRFIDTTYYVLYMEDGVTTTGSAEVSKEKSREEYLTQLIINYMDEVKKMEENERADCETFRAFAAQFTFNDSLRQDAMCYFAECSMQNNSIEEARQILEVLCESKSKLNKNIAPRAYARLGQLYCLLGDRQNADKYSKILKKQFPKSKYIQLADCNKI